MKAFFYIILPMFSLLLFCWRPNMKNNISGEQDKCAHMHTHTHTHACIHTRTCRDAVLGTVLCFALTVVTVSCLWLSGPVRSVEDLPV